MTRGIALTLGLAIIAGSGLWTGACSRSEHPGRRVVLYYTVDEVYARPIIEAFERDTGIRVDGRTDTEATKTTGLVGRLRLEKDDAVADVFWSSEPFMTEQLAREGVLAPMKTEALSAWPRAHTSPEQTWYALADRARVLVYRKGRVAEPESPRTMHDLLDPKWEGRIVMARPEFGTTRGHMARLVALWGRDEARAWMAGLEANGVRLLDGNSAVVRAVASGEADIGLTDTDDVWAGQRNGWEIDLIYIRHDTPSGDLHGVMTISNTVSRVAGGPNPDTAARLMEYLVSERVERLLAESDSHNYPVSPALRAEFSAYEPPDPMPLEIGAVVEAMDEAMAACRETFGG